MKTDLVIGARARGSICFVRHLECGFQCWSLQSVVLNGLREMERRTVSWKIYLLLKVVVNSYQRTKLTTSCVSPLNGFTTGVSGTSLRIWSGTPVNHRSFSGSQRWYLFEQADAASSESLTAVQSLPHMLENDESHAEKRLSPAKPCLHPLCESSACC